MSGITVIYVSIYFTEGGKYGKTTVTFKKPQVEKKATQVKINSSSLNYLEKPTQQTAQKIENSRHKESPTLQVVRPTRYRSNLPSSNPSQNSSSVVLCSFLTMVAALRRGGSPPFHLGRQVVQQRVPEPYTVLEL